MASQQCITPNPDISGIGVRVAIYVQSFLLAIQTYKALLKGKVDEEEEQQLESSWTNSMLFTIGIVLSAIIQAGLGNLSLHHGLVTLNLCWLIIFSEIPSMGVVLWVTRVKAATMLTVTRRRRWRDNMKIIVSIHVLRAILCYTLGLVVWASADPADPCTQLTDYVVLFKYAISPASRGLRFTSIAIYAFSLAVGIIGITGVIIFKTISKSKSKPKPRDSGGASQDVMHLVLDTPDMVFWITSFTFYQVYFIACTEIMVKKNAHLFIGGEAQEDAWTFGQTLALLMLSTPLLEFVNALWEGKEKMGDGLNVQPASTLEEPKGRAMEEDEEVDPSRVGDIESGDRESRE